MPAEPGQPDPSQLTPAESAALLQEGLDSLERRVLALEGQMDHMLRHLRPQESPGDGLLRTLKD